MCRVNKYLRNVRVSRSAEKFLNFVKLMTWLRSFRLSSDQEILVSDTCQVCVLHMLEVLMCYIAIVNSSYIIFP